jgi:hypothetical protein
MFAQTSESLKRIVVGGLGAVLFGLTCLVAAAGPAQTDQVQVAAATVSPATTLQS